MTSHMDHLDIFLNSKECLLKDDSFGILDEVTPVYNFSDVSI